MIFLFVFHRFETHPIYIRAHIKPSYTLNNRAHTFKWLTRWEKKKVCDKWVRNSNCVRLCQLDCKTFKGMKSTGYEIPMVSLIHLKRIWSYMTEEKVYTHTNQKKQCPVALRAEFKWAVELIAAHLFDPYRSLYHYIDLPHICNLQKVFLLMMPFFPP